MKHIDVKPVYGYGWRQAHSTIDTPEPFTMRVEGCEKTSDQKYYAKLSGQIVGTSHSYAGKWALLQIRSLGPEPNYNVLIYGFPITSKDLLGGANKAAPVATGFAMLPSNEAHE